MENVTSEYKIRLTDKEVNELLKEKRIYELTTSKHISFREYLKLKIKRRLY